jgi:hypothetical protein
MDQNNQSGGNRVYLAIIFVLLLLNIGVGWMLYQEKKQNTQLTEKNTSLDNQYNTLKTDFAAQSQSLEEFKGKNAELDQIIQDRQAQIEKQVAEIDRLKRAGKLDKAAVAKYKDMVARLEADNRLLADRVAQLSKENADLSQIREQLTQDLSEEKANTSRLSEQNTALSSKVELGKLLQTNRLKVSGILVRNSGKEVETNKLKRTQKLKISWETGDNKVLDPGPVSLYVRIINPRGETISVADQGSGTFQPQDSPSPMQYSRKADIDFQGTNKSVNVYWGQNLTDKGTYSVEIYQGGYKIGEGSCVLN